jgi:RNA polymerase sigma factor for flagellar operon FliA
MTNQTSASVQSSGSTRGRGGAVRRTRYRVQASRETRSQERRREREELTLKLMGLVRRVAREMCDHLPAHVDIDDLTSAGTVGLLEAMKRFETGKQVKIETYARYRIRGAILDALRELDPASRDMRRRNKHAERVFHELAHRLGRPATDSEMAEAMHMTLKEWYRTVNEFRTLGVEWLRPTQMPTLQCSEPNDLPALGQRGPFELCYAQERRDFLNRALASISARDREVLSLYYEHNLTMKQIADRMGIDESRVSQIHSATVSRLRNRVQSMVRATTRDSARTVART